MRLYDLVLVLKTSLTEAQRTKVVDQVKSWLGDVKVVNVDDWGQKPLAYPIKKEAAGVYVKFNLETEKTILMILKQEFLELTVSYDTYCLELSKLEARISKLETNIK